MCGAHAGIEIQHSTAECDGRVGRAVQGCKTASVPKLFLAVVMRSDASRSRDRQGCRIGRGWCAIAACRGLALALYSLPGRTEAYGTRTACMHSRADLGGEGLLAVQVRSLNPGRSKCPYSVSHLQIGVRCQLCQAAHAVQGRVTRDAFQSARRACSGAPRCASRVSRRRRQHSTQQPSPLAPLASHQSITHRPPHQPPHEMPCLAAVVAASTAGAAANLQTITTLSSVMMLTTAKLTMYPSSPSPTVVAAEAAATTATSTPTIASTAPHLHLPTRHRAPPPPQLLSRLGVPRGTPASVLLAEAAWRAATART
jgi:hypothetical protein